MLPEERAGEITPRQMGEMSSPDKNRGLRHRPFYLRQRRRGGRSHRYIGQVPPVTPKSFSLFTPHAPRPFRYAIRLLNLRPIPELRRGDAGVFAEHPVKIALIRIANPGGNFGALEGSGNK